MSRTAEERLGDLLGQTGETVATAESCSGGLIAHRITNVSGSSRYFLGGVVSYSNAAKMSLLDVDEKTLEEHGAVSDAVAREMAEGARRQFSSSYGLGVTGIAGPTGGTEDKPVGLVYIAVATPSATRIEACTFTGGREEVKRQTAEYALTMLLESIR